MSDRPSLKQMQAACDRFNERHDVGDSITVFPGIVGEAPQVVQVRLPAQVMSGHTAVVYVTGGYGCIALSHVVKAMWL